MTLSYSKTNTKKLLCSKESCFYIIYYLKIEYYIDFKVLFYIIIYFQIHSFFQMLLIS